MNSRTSTVGMVLAVLLVSPMVRAEEKVSAEEQLLRKAGIGTDSDKLLAFVRLRSQAEEDLRSLDALVRRLGHDDFAERQKASAKLIALDRAALPALRRVIADKDAEVARRARACIAAIERGSIPGLPLAVVRMLLQKRPPGTVAALVGYLPFAADEEVEEVIYFGLEKLCQGTALDESFLKALRDPLSQRRALAACLVGRWGSEAQRRQVRKLLEDGDAEERLRAAQGLLGANDASGLPALVALLETPSLPLAWQAEELLHYAAGDQTPKAVVGRGSAKERKACRIAWEGWLRTQGSKIDLQSRQKMVQRPGLVLVFEGKKNWNGFDSIVALAGYWNRHIWLSGCEGQKRCNPYDYIDFKVKLLKQPRLRCVAVCGHASCRTAIWSGLLNRNDDVPWLPGREKDSYRPESPAILENGNCIRVVETDSFDSVHRVVELDPKSRVVWEFDSSDLLCAMAVWPLVRVGFGRHMFGDMDMDTPSARVLALKHPQAIVRRLAAERLRTFPVDKAICRAMVEALNDSDLGVQGHALRFLEKAPPKEIYSGIPRLVHLLCNPENERLGRPGFVLKRCGGKAIPALVAAFENRKEQNATKRRSNTIFVLAWLVDLPDPLLHRTLRAAFEDKDPEVRKSIVTCVTSPKTKARRSYIPLIIRRLKDPNPKVIKAAMDGLSEWGEVAQAAVPDLIILLNKPDFRDDAIYTLGAVGHNDPTVLPVIIEQKKNQDEAYSLTVVLPLHWISMRAGNKRRKLSPC